MAQSSTVKKQHWTLEEWLATELEPRYEFENGRLVRMASPTRRHQRIVGKLFGQLDNWMSWTGLGFVEMEIDVALPTGVGYIPDLVFVRYERESELYTPDGKIRGVPDLVVEVISPGTRRRDTVHKLRAYQEAGVPWYWLVDSETLVMQEFRLTPTGYRIETVADAGEVFRPAALPGFEMNLQELLED
ncbi:MAG: Uma2 family endonuclease [Armatimonadota bacterium]